VVVVVVSTQQVRPAVQAVVAAAAPTQPMVAQEQPIRVMRAVQMVHQLATPVEAAVVHRLLEEMELEAHLQLAVLVELAYHRQLPGLQRLAQEAEVELLILFPITPGLALEVLADQVAEVRVGQELAMELQEQPIQVVAAVAVDHKIFPAVRVLQALAARASSSFDT